jgi:phosphoglycolate phosphatase-like HAD superfamily hydrolase
MSNQLPAILALDFDGVICDGSQEYFQTTKQTYYQIWHSQTQSISDDLAPTFYRLRPVIETGWEMPILLRAIILEISEQEIFKNWSKIAQKIIETEKLNPKEISTTLDRLRDKWIASDLESWLALHRFYPGVIEKIKQVLNSAIAFYIVTTKESRFVRQLLQQQGISLSETAIFGKEFKRPKYETIRELLLVNSVDPAQLWFVEDRLEALDLIVRQPDLQTVKLYLANWGYNTQQTRDSLSDRSEIKLLSLKQFQDDFSTW